MAHRRLANTVDHHSLTLKPDNNPSNHSHNSLPPLFPDANETNHSPTLWCCVFKGVSGLLRWRCSGFFLVYRWRVGDGFKVILFLLGLSSDMGQSRWLGWLISGCTSDIWIGISFIYPPSLSIFWEMIERKISFEYNKKILYDDELSNNWIPTNEQKRNNLSNELNNRFTILDKDIFYIDVLNKKARLCLENKNNKTKRKFM